MICLLVNNYDKFEMRLLKQSLQMGRKELCKFLDEEGDSCADCGACKICTDINNACDYIDQVLENK